MLRWEGGEGQAGHLVVFHSLLIYSFFPSFPLIDSLPRDGNYCASFMVTLCGSMMEGEVEGKGEGEGGGIGRGKERM